MYPLLPVDTLAGALQMVVFFFTTVAALLSVFTFRW